MINIVLPIELDVGGLGSSMEVLGKIITFSETPLQISVSCLNTLDILRSTIQFKEGNPQETVDVQIVNESQLREKLINIFKFSDCVTNTSIEQILLNILSESLVGHFTNILGLNAARSLIYITPTEELYYGLANSLLSILQKDSDMRQYIYEQYFNTAPERFFPGKDDAFKPIPFEVGDSLAFYLQLSFANAKINGETMYLSDFLSEDEMPTLRHIIILNIES
jgi:hypothetical protein